MGALAQDQGAGRPFNEFHCPHNPVCAINIAAVEWKSTKWLKSFQPQEY